MAVAKVAVFGGSFDPPSLGHKSVIDSLSYFDLVLLVPSIAHAWGKKMLDYHSRCVLLDAFIGDLSLENLKKSTIEQNLFTSGYPVKTYEVLTALQKEFPDSTITFVVGADNLLSFHKFHQSKEILRQFSVLACPEKVPVRSTTIREALISCRSIENMSTPSVVALLLSSSWYKEDVKKQGDHGSL